MCACPCEQTTLELMTPLRQGRFTAAAATAKERAALLPPTILF
jgi:hypothetical protein